MATSDVHPLVDQLVTRLRERGETLAFAESCTGGLLSSMVTVMPGSSDVFLGSIVAYDNQVKTDLLGVPQTLLRAVGAVSVPVAKRMSEGARKVLRASWAASITGVAGPGGGSEQKPVGTVCFGLSGPGVERVEQQLFEGTRRKIQTASALHALQMLLNELGSAESETGGTGKK